MVERVLFEQPWALMFVLVAAGVVGALACVRQGRRKLAPLVLIAGLGLAAVNFGVATAVTTSRERCVELTRETVKAVIAADATALAPLLRSDLVVRPFGLSRDGVLAAVVRYMKGEYAVKSSSIQSLSATQDSADAVRTQLHIRVTPENSMYGYPPGSWWILTWQRSPGTDNWLLTQIECQQIDGVNDLSGVRP